jgi:hypothetical protein
MPMILAAALMAAAPQGASARGRTAEQALETYRKVFRPTPILDCPPAADPETITVCGRRSDLDPDRVPLPVEGTAGERVRLVPGEAPRASTNVGGCLHRCPQPLTVNVLSAVPAIVEGIKRILDPDR